MDINSKRLIKHFIDLVGIPSPSWEEEAVADYIIRSLKKYGLEIHKYKCGKSYNLLVRMKGNASKTPVLFSAHMDTVTPCENVRPVITDKRISSDKTTILGADDKAAIAAFIETINYIKENNVQHGPLEFLFSCAEETGLHGIKGFDLSLLDAKYAFVFDSGGATGKVVLKAPYQITCDMKIKGRSAHAGIAPERGINAIRVASEIISKIPIGRIDRETTTNVGIISGGRARNIVADEVSIELEARSISRKKLKTIENRMESIAKTIVKKNKAKLILDKKLEYSGYSISRNEKIVQVLDSAFKKINIKPVYEISGGGSDTNIINRSGIRAVNLSIGMQDVHTINEYININDLIDGTRLVIAIIDSV